MLQLVIGEIVLTTLDTSASSMTTEQTLFLCKTTLDTVFSFTL